MYRFLDKRFYHNKINRFDLREFSYEHIGLSRSYKDCGKLKEKLGVGISELEEIGFIERAGHNQRFQREGRGRWHISFTRKREKNPLAGPSDTPSNDLGFPHLVTELVNRGVTKPAVELVQRHPAETIQPTRRVRLADGEAGQAGRQSPAGYLVKSITDDYAAPKGFVSKAERQRQEEARQAKERQAAEERRRRQEEEARERAEKKAIAAYWDSLTPEQQAELDAAADATADPELMAMDDGPLKRIGQRLRRNGYIQRLLEDREQVPAEA